MTSYLDIKKQIQDLERKAEEQRKRELLEIIEDIKQKMKAYGLTVADLGMKPVKVKTTGVKAKPKFRDPASGKTWSGRGQTPNWLKAYETKGKHREEFAL